MSTFGRPGKRTRQACEPCRRKKSRCPGEKPVCSHCSRLGQECAYAPETDRSSAGPVNRNVQSTSSTNPPALDTGVPQNMVERLQALEANLAAMQSSINNQPWRVDQSLSSSTARTTPSRNPVDLDRPPISQAAKLPPLDTITSIAQSYLTYCNNQPLPLFSPSNFIATLTSRDPEILFAILALGSRFYLGADNFGRVDEDYAETATKLVMRRIPEGPIELSTIQSLCILSLIEFTNGNSPRASTYSSLAMDLTQSAGLASENHQLHLDSICEERRRCYWSVTVLKNLYANPNGSFAFIINEKTPRYPQSDAAPLGTSTNMPDADMSQSNLADTLDNQNDPGILACAIQLIGLWQKAARYARRRGKTGPLPDWSSKSEYSEITAQLMELETWIPPKYRFRPSRFTDQSAEDLQNSRDFWAPWLLIQLLYHSILCLLNHPLLLSLRLRNFKVTQVPEVFLQQTADLIGTHTDWMIHILDLLEAKRFEASDPFLAHCVATAATIYLQQSCTDDVTIRNIKQQNFKKCVTFISRLGKYWPYISQLAEKFESFEQVVTSSFRNTELYNSPDASVFIDLSLFWDIMESSFTNDIPTARDSYFGTSLTSHRSNSNSAEVIRSRLLPEPTRLGHVIQESSKDQSVLFNDQLAVLAQSYFAQGQDFVGNMDDWWSLGQSL